MFRFSPFAWLAYVIDRILLAGSVSALTVVCSIEWIFHRLVQPVFQRVAMFVLWVVLLPVGILSFGVGFIGAHTIGSAWLRWTLDKMGQAIGFGVFALRRFLEFASRSWALRWIVWLINLWLFVWHLVYDWTCAWLLTRRYRRLVLAAPVLCLGAAMCVMLARMPFYNKGAKARHYRQAAFEALHSKQDQAVDLYFRKLTDLGELRPDVAYLAAIEKSNEGQWDEAYRQMSLLAPEDEPGYGFAHRWIAVMGAAGKFTWPAKRSGELLQKHLEYSVQLLPDDPTSIQLLADLYISAGRVDEGTKLLERLEKMNLSPANRAKLAATLQRWGKTESAHTAARMAISQFSALEHQRRQLAPEEIVLWAACQEAIGEYADAMETMTKAVESKDAPASLRELAVDRAIHFLNHRHKLQLSRDQWLRIASASLRIAPDSEKLQVKIGEWLVDSTMGHRIDALFRNLASTGKLSVAAYMMLADANVAFVRHDQARADYAAVLKMDGTHYRAANNLAWLLASTEPVDLNEALRVANVAVSSGPDVAYVRETRAQIHFKLGHWAEAAADFELALNGLPDYLVIHEHLSTCYERLGNSDLAKVHRHRATALRQAANR